MYNKESIRNLLEDIMELSQQTLENIRKSEKDIKARRVKSLAQVESRLKR